MSRNYGIGSRDMDCAGRMVLKTHFHGGYQSIYDLGQRWAYFCRWAQTQGIKKMEMVTRDLVIQYGHHLKAQMDQGLRKSASSPKNYVSAVNTVMRLATGYRWESVKPGRDCGIPRRNYVAQETKAISAATHDEAKTKVEPRTASLLDLQRSLGLRFKESSLLDAKKAIKQAKACGKIIVKAGTKGGRKRIVPVGPEAMAALDQAVKIQDGHSMIPKDSNYKAFRQDCYLQSGQADIKYHGERHAYAQTRYHDEIGAPSPVVVGWDRKTRIERLAQLLHLDRDEAKRRDEAARLKISKELGHNRLEITYAYLG